MSEIYTKEILIINLDEKIKLYLTVNFYKNNNNFIVKAKKIDFKIISTNLELEDAKNEFAKLIIEYLKYLVKENIIFKVFDYFNIQYKFENEIKNETNEELKSINNSKKKNINKFSFNPSKLLYQEKIFNPSDINLDFHWNQY